MNFKEVLKILLNRLSAAGVEAALSGGLALSTMGLFRFTKDIDFVIPAEGVDAVDQIMTALGYEKQGCSSSEIASYVSPLKVDATIELREMAKRHGWAVLAAAALDADSFAGKEVFDLSDLFGDERVPYTADRVYVIARSGEPMPCGCVDLAVHTLKDRTDPVRNWDMQFWGERFYPALQDEKDTHAATMIIPVLERETVR